VTEMDLFNAVWHKSSYSGQSGNCVEVARNLPGLVAVRDSKNPGGGKLVVSPETWQLFIRGSLTPRKARGGVTASDKWRFPGLSGAVARKAVLGSVS
jgi:hypothetical protein